MVKGVYMYPEHILFASRGVLGLAFDNYRTS